MFSARIPMFRRIHALTLSVAVATLFGVPCRAALPVNPVPFTPNSPPGSANTQGAPIGFSFAGNKFVGSVLGDGYGRLYYTDLNGTYQGVFGGTPVSGVYLNPIAGLEHYVSSSVGLGGFPNRDIYVASGDNVEHLSNTGADLGLVINGSLGGLNSDVRGITFDMTGNYGFNMIVTTRSGRVYTVDSLGTPTQIADTGEDTEGLDISPQGPGAKWGGLNGVLFVASEGGTIRAIKPSNAPNTPGITVATNVFGAEQLDFVPLNLGTGGSLEGMYSANYSLDVLKAPGSDFMTPFDMRGDMIVTSETLGAIYRFENNPITSVVTQTTVGQFPNQPEDGLFVTADIINAPEPASVALLGAGALMILARRRRA